MASSYIYMFWTWKHMFFHVPSSQNLTSELEINSPPEKNRIFSQNKIILITVLLFILGCSMEFLKFVDFGLKTDCSESYNGHFLNHREGRWVNGDTFGIWNLSLPKKGFFFCTSISGQAIEKHRPTRSNAIESDFKAWKISFLGWKSDKNVLKMWFFWKVTNFESQICRRWPTFPSYDCMLYWLLQNLGVLSGVEMFWIRELFRQPKVWTVVAILFSVQ